MEEEKLKTLKEMFEFAWMQEDDVKIKCIREDELKAEAVKWVKMLEADGRYWSANDFKEFFNLTEKDLE